MTSKNKSVLVIDNDIDFCLLVKTILEKKEMQIDFVFNIAEAKEYLSQSTPGIIILDLHLDNEFGITFLKERSENPKLANIPVIVCSTDNLADVVRDAVRYGADDYLIKPINPAWLIQRMKKCLLKEKALSFFFDEEVEVDLIAETKPLLVADNAFLGRSNIGFNKNTEVNVSVLDKVDGTVHTINFTTQSKSKFSSSGNFDSLFFVTGSEEENFGMLKKYWRFE